MFKVIACMAAGMVSGRLLRIKGLQKPIIAVTWLLLLFLGWETGSDREVIRALPSIGLAAAGLSMGGIPGSCALAWLLWKNMGGRTERKGTESTEAGRMPVTEHTSGEGVSIWSGMGGSLVILGFFIAGIALGLCGLLSDSSIVH